MVRGFGDKIGIYWTGELLQQTTNYLIDQFNKNPDVHYGLSFVGALPVMDASISTADKDGYVLTPEQLHEGLSMVKFATDNIKQGDSIILANCAYPDSNGKFTVSDILHGGLANWFPTADDMDHPLPNGYDELRYFKYADYLGYLPRSADGGSGSGSFFFLMQRKDGSDSYEMIYLRIIGGLHNWGGPSGSGTKSDALLAWNSYVNAASQKFINGNNGDCNHVVSSVPDISKLNSNVYSNIDNPKANYNYQPSYQLFTPTASQGPTYNITNNYNGPLSDDDVTNIFNPPIVVDPGGDGSDVPSTIDSDVHTLTGYIADSYNGIKTFMSSSISTMQDLVKGSAGLVTFLKDFFSWLPAPFVNVMTVGFMIGFIGFWFRR